jgi:hypothetical protein
MLGRLVCRGLKEGVSLPSPSTLGDDEFALSCIEVNDELSSFLRCWIYFKHLSADRKLDNDVLSGTSILARPAT